LVGVLAAELSGSVEDSPFLGGDRRAAVPARAHERRDAGDRIMTAMVPAESRFGAVPIEVLDRNPVPNAVASALDRGVPAFGGVGMRLGGGVRIGANVFTSRVVDPQVSPKLAPNPTIRWQFVGGRNAVQGHIAEQKGGDRPLGMRPALLRPRPAAALDGGDNHGLAASSLCPGPIAVSVPAGFLPALALAADVRFVGLDDAAQQARVARHHSADAVTEKPCRLLADAEMPPQSDARQPLAGHSEKLQRREPCPHRKVAFERRSHRHGELGVTGFAEVVMHPAAFHRRTDVPALRTDWTVRPAHSFEMRPTGVVTGKLLEKGHDRDARQPIERSPRRLKDFAVASWLRHSPIRTLAFNRGWQPTPCGDVFWQPGDENFPVGQEATVTNPAIQFRQRTTQHGAYLAGCESLRFPHPLATRRSGLVSGLHDRRTLGCFGAIAGAPRFDVGLCPIERLFRPAALSGPGPTSPGIRRSGFTHPMSSSLERERYSAALPVVRKRKSSVMAILRSNSFWSL
jgi:hypothetical protein